MPPSKLVNDFVIAGDFRDYEVIFPPVDIKSDLSLKESHGILSPSYAGFGFI